MCDRLHATRLETRTKESITCASSHQMILQAELMCVLGLRHQLPTLSNLRLRMSMRARTRKMVNYACEG